MPVKCGTVTAWKPPTVVVIMSLEPRPVPFVAPEPLVPPAPLLESEPLVELLPLVLPAPLVESEELMSLWIQS